MFVIIYYNDFMRKKRAKNIKYFCEKYNRDMLKPGANWRRYERLGTVEMVKFQIFFSKNFLLKIFYFFKYFFLFSNFSPKSEFF